MIFESHTEAQRAQSVYFFHLSLRRRQMKILSRCAAGFNIMYELLRYPIDKPYIGHGFIIKSLNLS